MGFTGELVGFIEGVVDLRDGLVGLRDGVIGESGRGVVFWVAGAGIVLGDGVGRVVIVALDLVMPSITSGVESSG